VTLLTASDIAGLVGGTLVGDGAVVVSGVAALDRAGPNDVSFYASAKYAADMASTSAGVVLVAPELAQAESATQVRVVVNQPHDAMLKIVSALHAHVDDAAPGIHPTARIGRGVTLGEDVSVDAYAIIGDGVSLGNRVRVGPHCVIGRDVPIGDDSRLYAAATIYPRAMIGQRVIIHAGARIASDGFGYVFRDGAHTKIPHVGRCIIEDDVEIGANSTLDRGSVDDTVIGAGTKIDNLVHIAHNVRIGKRCLIMAQVGIAGSARVGDGVILAGQVGLSGHLTIGDGARLAAQAGVFGDVPAGETWGGYPARKHSESLRASAALFKLAGMVKQLERLLAERG
jgi:UDP-3-O-[3-hydroxymyristoyl] glucosamine N-acyltransferase